MSFYKIRVSFECDGVNHSGYCSESDDVNTLSSFHCQTKFNMEEIVCASPTDHLTDDAVKEHFCASLFQFAVWLQPGCAKGSLGSGACSNDCFVRYKPVTVEYVERILVNCAPISESQHQQICEEITHWKSAQKFSWNRQRFRKPAQSNLGPVRLVESTN